MFQSFSLMFLNKSNVIQFRHYFTSINLDLLIYFRSALFSTSYLFFLLNHYHFHLLLYHLLNLFNFLCCICFLSLFQHFLLLIFIILVQLLQQQFQLLLVHYLQAAIIFTLLSRYISSYYKIQYLDQITKMYFTM